MAARILFRWCIALTLAACATAAHAFCNRSASDYLPRVLETYDAATDRFFESWSTPAPSLDCGANTLPTPPSTRFTGLSWRGLADVQTCAALAQPGNLPCALARPVCAFESRSGATPPSRFLTINPGECAALKQPGSGWTFLPPSPFAQPGGVPALALFEVDPATQRCTGGTVPVYRFVNSRFAEGLVNHRYVADERAHAQMRNRPGWIEEGIAFCALDALAFDVSASFQDLSILFALGPPGAPSACTSGTGRSDFCIESDHMLAPRERRGPYTADAFAPFFARTGAQDGGGYVLALPTSSDAQAASRSFVQVLSSPGAGFFITSADRTEGNLSSLRSVTYPHASDALASRPFASVYDVPMDLVIDFRIFVKHIATAPGGNAYVQPLVTLADHASGHRLILSTGAIGTVPAADLVTRDAATGYVLVFLTLPASPGFGRSAGLPSLLLPGTFESDHPWGTGGDFSYRVNATELARVVALARSLDPALSANPADYGVESFGMKAEVAGPAEMGCNVERLAIHLSRP